MAKSQYKQSLGIFLILALVLLAACAPVTASDPCAPEAIEPDISALNSLYVQWWDQMEIAEATPRILLGAEIAELQAIRRAAMSIEVSACMQPALTAMLNFQQAFIEGYLGFMANDASAEAHFDEGFQYLDAFIDEMQEHAGWQDRLSALGDARATLDLIWYVAQSLTASEKAERQAAVPAQEELGGGDD